MADFGITVSSNNVSTTNANTPQQVLTSKYPLAKIDRTKQTSFQNIHIFFANEPPAPAVGDLTTTTVTLLYRFAHGYTYTPSIWTFYRAVGVTGSFIVGGITYFMDSGVIGGNNTGVNSPYAYIDTIVDSTYVSIYLYKYTGVGPQIFVAGSGLNIRSYVFAEDLGV